ncbi:hypothetical protein ACH47X_08020 [Promicromonospora kroppenstedtii]|uniref:EVE domain-containing protein n=1 Tax=Promicromonospora kroppenstedtii TaxID=440482 RepID=A0ABW7XHN4_9MICO
MTHWLYPVNRDSWGYKASPTMFMAGKKHTYPWRLPRKLEITTGDLIWVRESIHPENPVAKVVGVGVVQSDEPEPHGGAFRFDVLFGTDLCRHLAANPFALVVDSIPMRARKLKDQEQAQLALALFEFTVAETRTQASGKRSGSLW